MKKLPVGLLALAFAPMLMGAHCTGQIIKDAVVDCGVATVKDALPSLLPVVAAIINNKAPDWQRELDALAQTGADALACAVQQIASGMAQTPAAAPGEAPKYVITMETMGAAKSYLQVRNVTVKH